MIKVVNKQDCCGCSACAQICPKQCITMVEDSEGFCYPVVNDQECVNCHLCEHTCPILNQNSPVKAESVYACVNPDEKTRMASSSGGVFSLLAEQTIKNGGVVFGACFDEKWGVKHSYAETLIEVGKFRGSKYVQSDIGNSYIKANEYLREGREVLFTGTSCQIAGLYRFLKQPYENLVTIDVLCHGVPSPMIWRDYLKSVCDNHKIVLSEIDSISFRSKQLGWRRFGMEINAKKCQIVSEPLDQNIYLKGFLRDLYLRPSCHNCRFRNGKCHSDITIADYWGIWNHHPQMDDDRGTSLILVNTPKGEKLMKKLTLKKTNTTYFEALSGNSPLEHSVKETPYRQLFWDRYPTEGLMVIDSICTKMQPGLFRRAVNKINSIIKR